MKPLPPLTVDLGPRSYPIHFGDGFAGLAQALAPIVKGRACAIVSNPAVWPLYGTEVSAAVVAAGGAPQELLVPDGEQFKNLREFERLLEELAAIGLTRPDVLLALGGGVVGDLAGFTAAAYMRGIAFVQIPTTLLAQVDSSIGGKTGVNLAAGKNLAGAFYQPRAVYINWNTLATLPVRECRAGYAEVIKYSVIADAALFELLERETPAIFAAFDTMPPRVPAVLGAIIRRCCAIKAEVVAEDERETGRRAILNYGHTFAHSIETLTHYEVCAHGEAVAIGMHAAARLAVRLGLCDPSVAERQERLLQAAGLATRFPQLDPAQVIAAFARDKKARGAELRFVLPRRIGCVEVVSNPDSAALRETLEECMTVGQAASLSLINSRRDAGAAVGQAATLSEVAPRRAKREAKSSSHQIANHTSDDRP